jgi:hypothetical protein
VDFTQSKHDAEPLVLVHQDGRKVRLSPGLNDVELREAPLLFQIESPAAGQAFFDDQPLPVVWSDNGRAGYGQLDLSNQVGYHRFTLRVAGHDRSFDFRTTTTKATRDEIEAMARVIAGQVFSFKRQFVYADVRGQPRSVRVAEVAFGWLRERLPELAKLTRGIDARPATETRLRFRTSHQARNVSVPQTLRLIRENPGLLEALPGGPLEVDGQKYWPSAVVVRERDREPARVEHTQLAHFLSQIARLVSELHGVVPQDLEGAVASWERTVAGLRATPIVQRHDTPNAHTAWTPLPTHLQRTQPNYRRVRELHSEFLQDIDVGDPSPDAIRANIRDVWEIYQTFAAHMIGRAFNLKYVSRRGDLRERVAQGFSMYSEEYELYYDCRVPPDVIASWRDRSTRPANERPDILLYHRPTRSVAVLDAKFKVDTDGTSAKNEDLFEMQGYLNSFALRGGGIIFPGTSVKPRFVDGGSVLLAEIPLRASFFANNRTDALAELKRSIVKVLHAPVSP